MSFSSTRSEAEGGRPWLWMAILGGLLIVLGFVAMAAPSFAAQALVVILGWLLVGGGVLQLGGAFLFRGFGGFGAELLFGALAILLGALLIWAPLVTGSLIALLIVIGLLADAIFEAIRALLARYAGWIWPVLIGLLALALGLAVIFNPGLLLQILGFLVGINLLIRGVIMLLVALEARKQSA